MLKQRSAFAAAAHVLDHPSMAWLFSQVANHATEEIDWAFVLEKRQMLSDGEKAMVDVARCIWNGSPADLAPLLGHLDQASWDRVVEALMAYKPASGTRPAAEVAEEAIGLFIETFESGGFSAHPDALKKYTADAVAEVRQGFAVRDEDIT